MFKYNYVGVLLLSIFVANVVIVTGIGSTSSCRGKCGSAYASIRPCQCNTDCAKYSNCCSDYTRICGASTGTSSGPDTTKCWDRCDTNYDQNLPCQCNNLCQKHNNCCPDYAVFCTSGTVAPLQTVTDGEISQLATLLTSLDVNAPSQSDYRLDRQSHISNADDKTDPSPNKLFSFVNEGALFSKATYATFIKLLDNYNPYYGQTESSTTTESNEEQGFIQAIMKTQVMQKAWSFLKTKGYSSARQTDFENQLKQLWFKKYSRKYGVMDSSGFEHVFVGEINTGTSEVSGLHNWVQFYLQEKAGKANYAGYFSYTANKVTIKFTWLNKWKPFGGFFVGTSPEWELAMSTVCFLLRPNGKCEFQMNGRTQEITSYDYHGHSDLIATAYPTN
ncbi:uridylate-specific endoribonuclease C-like [Lineus longissimus]|uniref:uridylate-specific endoribonuclease C-like n=1 Tax=Lineus longissimus TaxID=88925 RepID=UPI002B4D9183